MRCRLHREQAESATRTHRAAASHQEGRRDEMVPTESTFTHNHLYINLRRARDGSFVHFALGSFYADCPHKRII